MTRNEPGTTGENEQDEARAGVDQHGSMIAAEEAFARETADERARAAEAGDERAQAEEADVGRPDRLWHAAEWLDGKLVPKLGPADLGPYEEETEESVRSHDVCPLCGHPMGEHEIDRSHPNAVLICPAEQIPKVESYEPLNEVGMPKRSARGES